MGLGEHEQAGLRLGVCVPIWARPARDYPRALEQRAFLRETGFGACQEGDRQNPDNEWLRCDATHGYLAAWGWRIEQDAFYGNNGKTLQLPIYALGVLRHG